MEDYYNLYHNISILHYLSNCVIASLQNDN